jgi:23S rRNA pseudouridine2605 synthase
VRRPDDVRLRRPSGAGLRPAGGLSLARALSKFGVSSRREAARWIAAGRVRVNGALERSPSRWIDPFHDQVVVDGRPADDGTPRVVLALHKPAGFITTRVDPAGRPTVYDALGDVGRWVFPVGRLDRDTPGLLILTNDHRLGERLTSPDHHVPKTYHARVLGIPDREALRALRDGVALDDGTVTRPAKVRVLGTPRSAPASRPPTKGESPRGSKGRGGREGQGSTWLEIVLTQGKNRQVRRMGTAVGHEVVELARVRVGRLDLGDLPSGEWRELEAREVEALLGPSGPGRQ